MVSRKRAKRAKPEPKAEKTASKVSPRNRPEVVLSIVHTDNTFRQPQHPLEKFTAIQPWIGKCIHCNTKLLVRHTGETSATIEHIKPLCDGGDPTDPRNLALACGRCNNEKGVRHDMHAGKGGRADEVIAQLQAKRAERWRDAT